MTHEICTDGVYYDSFIYKSNEVIKKKNMNPKSKIFREIIEFKTDNLLTKLRKKFKA